MKLQRTTLILILLALGLGGFVYYYEVKAAPKQESTKTQGQKIFSLKKDQIQSITIKKLDQTLKFERVNQKPEDKSPITPWQMKAPLDAPASDASVSFLLDLLVDGKNNRSFTVPVTQLQDYGLDKAQTTIEFQLKNQQTHQLILGKPDFNHSYLYAIADPPANPTGQVQVLLVPVDFEYAVNRPMSEWQLERFNKKDSSSHSQDKPTPENLDKPSPHLDND